MTGFGRGEAVTSGGVRVFVQISSVNRKQLEMRFSLPGELAECEISGRKIIANAVSRGSLQIKCHIIDSPAGSGASVVNEVLLDELIRQCSAARVRANLSREVAVESLLSLPGVLNIRSSNEASEELTEIFEAALKSALKDFCEMRRKEGDALKTDLLARLEKLEQWHCELEAMTSVYPEIAKQRIMSRLENEKLPVSADDPGVMREVLFYVDKGDVTEEITRLASHFRQFRAFLESGEPVGRNMDFLAQEIFREITTLGNKAAVAGASPLVVAFKAEMEKIREQIQNIE